MTSPGGRAWREPWWCAPGGAGVRINQVSIRHDGLRIGGSDGGERDSFWTGSTGRCPGAGDDLFGPENFIKVESGHEVTFTGKLTGTGGIEIGGHGGFVNDGGLVRINGDAEFYAMVFSGTKGILEVNGTIRSTADPIYIRMLAKLRGNGTILGSVDGGDISPGPDGLPGQMTISQLTGFEDPPTTYIADLTGSLAGEQYDRLVVRDGVFLS